MRINRSIRFRRVVPAIALVLGVALCGVFATSAGAKPKKPKPDLVVKDFEFESTPSESMPRKVPYALIEIDGHATFGVSFDITNKGDKTAKESTVRIDFGARCLRREASRAGSIRDKSATVREDFDRASRARGTTRSSPARTLATTSDESKEANNCSDDLVFRAVPDTWLVDEFSFYTSSTEPLTRIIRHVVRRDDGVRLLRRGQSRRRRLSLRVARLRRCGPAIPLDSSGTGEGSVRL